MLRSLVESRARIRLVIPALLAYGVAVAVMFGLGPWPGLVSRVRQNCAGLDPLDVSGFWTADEARELVSSCGSAGHTAYLQLQLADLAYPLVTAAALVLSTAWLLRRYGSRTWPLLLPAVLMAALDYAENVAVWTLLARWPHVDGLVATLGGPVSAIKQVLGFVAFLLLLGLFAVDLAYRIRTAAGRRRALDPTR